MRGSKKKIGRGDRPVCSDRRERRSGDADFVLAGGARAEPSHPRLQTKKLSRSDTIHAATIVTRMGGDADTAALVAARLERDRAKRGAAQISRVSTNKQTIERGRASIAFRNWSSRDRLGS